MFGAFRWALAHMVMLSHLWPAASLWAGPYAVFGFWALSGFLMTLVLERSYGGSGSGVSRYLANRALRIYPPYLATLVLALPLLSAFPWLARSVSTMRIPVDATAWLQNLVIFTTHLDRLHAAGPIPPIWSVDIELWFYLAMPLLVRRRAVLVLWFAASVGWAVWLVVGGQPFNARYSNLAAASLPYSAGALCASFRAPLGRLFAARWHLPLSLALFALNAALPRAAFGWGFYASLAATLYVIVAWGRLRPRQVPRTWARLDARLGDLSYTVFLCHWPVALAVLALGAAHGKGAALYFAALPLVNACAWGIHRGVEQPIARLRDRVRGAPRAGALPGS
jgi:peptidoglycan/LPS O-acetylase OafA/YrhL